MVAGPGEAWADLVGGWNSYCDSLNWGGGEEMCRGRVVGSGDASKLLSDGRGMSLKSGGVIG
jgi:hypothetical protein